MLCIDTYGNFYFDVIVEENGDRIIYEGYCIGFTMGGTLLFLPEMYFDETDLAVLYDMYKL